MTQFKSILEPRLISKTLCYLLQQLHYQDFQNFPHTSVMSYQSLSVCCYLGDTKEGFYLYRTKGSKRSNPPSNCMVLVRNQQTEKLENCYQCFSLQRTYGHLSSFLATQCPCRKRYTPYKTLKHGQSYWLSTINTEIQEIFWS